MSALSLDEFKKVELRVAKVLNAEEIPGADRLWKLTIDVGLEKKQMVAGIKLFYTKEAIIGRSVIVVNNLNPATIRGVESYGMILAAKDGGVLSVLTLDKELPAGSAVG
ncbi:MAG: methionine--tRNA ligase subunit beta [Candidatus Omnitrophica bacterium CG07_land_8_20_14_0_80_50_8]|nr:MAG: methionine--tRNA ligase subunit beta [Candidatus Omnitrophica bacterium CG1_02_49_16]PIU39969.1 MAG: methionine--tRNA ligase subunit beta [Candidatus Omnitrophica bacterium CG07_land_8_20_14_0_80_50_8]